MVLLAKRVSALRPPAISTSTLSALEYFLIFSNASCAFSLVSMGVEIVVGALISYVPLYALPTFILRKRAGEAPWPVPMTCCGCPLPQFGVPHKTHSSREQIASMEFQNSVVIPE